MNAPNTDASTSRFVTITEAGQPLRLHYNDVGSGSEVVVMLHGSGPGASGWANFHRNIEPLVDARYRVILLDCPGWSKSDTIASTGSRSDLNAAVSRWCWTRRTSPGCISSATPWAVIAPWALR
ncbi:2-hydroxy-6-oxo-6-phenylhexa-2,4-dienoate hydrolase [Comamonas testosteroni]|nr:2-hydroxy-6-oxo-6-phenylhexa-2,4-dienoate hydrolase [Comamonas testosteroni]